MAESWNVYIESDRSLNEHDFEISIVDFCFIFLVQNPDRPSVSFVNADDGRSAINASSRCRQTNSSGQSVGGQVNCFWKKKKTPTRSVRSVSDRCAGQ